MKDIAGSFEWTDVSGTRSTPFLREEVVDLWKQDKSISGNLETRKVQDNPETKEERQLKRHATQCMMSKDYQGAEQAYRSLLELQETLHGQDSREVAGSSLGLGMALSRQGKGAEAESILARSVALYEKHEGPQGYNVAITLRELGNNYQLLGKGEQAEAALGRSVRILEKTGSPSSPVLAFHLTDLAVCRTKLGKYAQAEEEFKRAVQILEKESPSSRSLPRTLEEYAKLLDLTGRKEEAEQLRARAQDIRTKP